MADDLIMADSVAHNLNLISTIFIMATGVQVLSEA